MLSFLCTVKFWIRIDDSLDVFAEHAVGGMLGLFFNSLFGADYIIGLDGVNTGILPGGWLNRNFAQMYIQVAYIVAATAYSFVMSALLAFLINLVPGLHLRASEEAELLGLDDDQLGEFAYDYVEVRRDYLAWTPAKGESGEGKEGAEDIPMEMRHGISDHKEMVAEKSRSHGSGENGWGNGYGEKVKRSAIIGDRHGQAAETALHPEMHSADMR